MILKTSASYPHTQSYVLKLHRDAAPRLGRIVGRLDHVTSGHQFRFTTGEELIACLAWAAEFCVAAATEETE